jgi:hypothetical protein
MRGLIFTPCDDAYNSIWGSLYQCCNLPYVDFLVLVYISNKIWTWSFNKEWIWKQRFGNRDP